MSDRLIESLQGAMATFREEAERMHDYRETGLATCRKVIQLCSKSIRAVHRQEFEKAKDLFDDANRTRMKARSALQPFPELFYAGYLQDAEKELVEAAVMSAIAQDQLIPTRDDLKVGLMTYLHGLAEAASESRRYILDRAREGNLDRALLITSQMEFIYDELIGFDFPDGMTGGLRRTMDGLRAVLERTRSDLSTTASQQELIRELKLSRSTD